MVDHARLLRRARAGDVAALEALLSPLVEPACQLAYAILHDWQEAEDAVQEGAVKAWRAVTRLREDTTSFRSWFFAIVSNEARTRRRSRWWSAIRVPDLIASTPEAGLEERASLRTDLDRAMSRLSETDRLILALHFYLDLRLEEVGSVLGMSAAAVKSRLYRATRSMRPSLCLREPA
jgi:RNA polymerase sigma-70 factor (ECF subfamily)